MRDSQNKALMRAFAAELKARRSFLEISQEELAHRCGLNRTFIAKVEIASTQPSLSVLLRIAEGVGVPLPELLIATLARYRRELKAELAKRSR